MVGMVRVALTLLTLALRMITALERSRSDLILENIALRHQLDALARTKRQPRLEPGDRVLWVALRQAWRRWTDVLVLVRPETVVAWHRKLAQRHWKLISRGPGRPRIDREVRGLIVRMATENPTWGAPRIHGELRALGLHVSERTVSRYLPRFRPAPSALSDWSTFIRVHREAIAAIDFLTVTTATFRVLYVFFAIHHSRREVLHVNVTAHPTAEWTAQQIREAFPYESTPEFLILDRDSIFSRRVRGTIEAMGVSPTRTSFRSPWQNGVAERWVGTLRRELLDHVIVLHERHLQHLLQEFVEYYSHDRTHLSLEKDTPAGRPVHSRPSRGARVVSRRRARGLHHRYVWREAA
jgi:transposase InsO family protein